MYKRILLIGIVLTAAMLACSFSSPSGPGQSGSKEEVATIVAATLQAANGGSTQGATSSTSQSAGILPHALYYETKDSNGHQQVYRLGTDGKTVTQLTSEAVDVDDFDVSHSNGSIAYISNNQLLLANADGGSRKVLFDGGPMSVSSDGGDKAFAQERVSNPRWTLDGKTIAFGHNGLNFYDLASEKINTVLTNQVDTSSGVTVLKEGYAPNLYSPDGSKLLINLLFYEGGSYAVYDPSNNSLTRLKRPDSVMVCCAAAWAADGSSIYTASDTIGYVDSGLWRFSASDGSGTALLPSTAADNSNNFANVPYPKPDGSLQFFFANQNGMGGKHVPETLVQSGADGVTNRTTLRPDSFVINGGLWAPDGSAVVILKAPDDNTWSGGAAILVPANGSPMTPLVPDANNLHWGQ